MKKFYIFFLYSNYQGRSQDLNRPLQGIRCLIDMGAPYKPYKTPG